MNKIKLKIVLINAHGLFRAKDQELGIDSDTGGQIKYVFELARALTENRDVEEVIVFTRQIFDPKVDSIYSKSEEKINEKARIVRIPFGPKRYLRKEKLWPYIDNFVDQVLNYLRRKKIYPSIFHGHYSESGYAASQLGRLLGIPTVFTGHSLGRIKKQKLVEKGKDEDKLNAQFSFDQRIEAEEFTMDTADCVITSTNQEVEEQYELYDHYRPESMEVIPPGVDLASFSPPDGIKIDCDLVQKIESFLDKPDKPSILAIARPDEKKNFETLIKVYGNSIALQEKANLVIIPGNREDIAEMDPGSRRVLMNILTMIDKYDLYGKVAYPKHHESFEIPLLYRWAAHNRSVFVNIAFNEPFGLTLLEAAASGLPVVATNDGGPRDIIAICKNGYLVDPLEEKEIEKKINKILAEDIIWDEFSENGLDGVNKKFTWKAHVDRYVKIIENVLYTEREERFIVRSSRNKRFQKLERLIITDIDNTLTGDDVSLKELNEILHNLPENIGFGVATGRRKSTALQLLNDLGAPQPDLLVTNVGTDIYYGDKLTEDASWRKQINYHWYPKRIKKAMASFDGVEIQSDEAQSRFKISYEVDYTKCPNSNVIKKHLREYGLQAKVVFSLGMYLDIIPIRAGDGLAIRQLAYRWGIPFNNILIAGDSGNDEAMLKGDTLGVVVGNYSKEMEHLKQWPRIYFAQRGHAGGIVEGLNYYNFLGDEIVVPNERVDGV